MVNSISCENKHRRENQKNVRSQINDIIRLTSDQFDKQLGYRILLPKLFWPTVRKKCSSDGEKLRSLEQRIQTVKGHTIFCNIMLF